MTVASSATPMPVASTTGAQPSHPTSAANAVGKEQVPASPSTQAKPPTTPVVSSNPAQAEIKPTLQELLEKYIVVKELTNQSHFKYEGNCTKCGWHTLQLSQQSALALLRQHVQQHWHDVAGQL